MFYNINTFLYQYNNLEYIILQNFSIISYISFSFILSSILALLSFLAILIFDYLTIYSGSGVDYGDSQKRSAYECGFEPFNDARITFDIKFYLIGILFLIFDLEIAFLFPWVFVLPKLSLFGFWSMFFFLIILIIGFVYEWRTGGLEW